MKIGFLWVLVLVMCASVAKAAVVLRLGLNDRDKSSVTWEFSDLDAGVALNGGEPVNGVKLSEYTLPGAKGSFSVTLSAAQKIDHLNPATWIFGPTTATIYGWNNMGWGVCSPGDFAGLLRLNPGEAFLLRFDLSNLTVSSGKTLAFSVLADADARSYRIYRRINRSSGMLVETISSAHSGFSPPVEVGDSVEFAITEAGYEDGGALFIKEFSFDVVPVTESGSRPVAKTVTKTVSRDKVAVQDSQVATELSSSLVSREVPESPEVVNDAKAPMSAAHLAIGIVICVIILIPGIMIVVKVIS